MNEEVSNNSRSNLGLILLSLAVIVFLCWQVIGSFRVHSELSKAMKNVTPAVGQAEIAQKNLENFVSDLLKLSETNDGAKAIVNKYQIKQNTNAQPAK